MRRRSRALAQHPARNSRMMSNSFSTMTGNRKSAGAAFGSNRLGNDLMNTYIMTRTVNSVAKAKHGQGYMDVNKSPIMNLTPRSRARRISEGQDSRVALCVMMSWELVVSYSLLLLQSTLEWSYCPLLLVTLLQSCSLLFYSFIVSLQQQYYFSFTSLYLLIC